MSSSSILFFPLMVQ